MPKDTANLYHTRCSDFQKSCQDPPKKFEKLMYDERYDRMYAAMPNSNLRVVIEEGSMYHDFFDVPQVQRLNGIKQLGTVSGDLEKGSSATHTRYVHSLITAIIAETVLTTYMFPQSDVNLGIISAMLHDAATPPYSDQGKLGALTDMDEEQNIRFVMEGDDLKQLLRKYDAKPDDIVACIRGEYPMIGQLMNSRDNIDLDRISYMSLDTHYFGIEDHARRFLKPDLFDIYEDIRMEDGQISFSDADRVGDFLALRAYMYHDAYYGGTNRGREAAMKRIMAKLWQDGMIGREKLLSMTDYDLTELVVKKFGTGMYKDIMLAKFPVFIEVACVTDKTVEDVRKEFPEPKYLVDQQRAFNPVTKTKIALPRGRIEEFRKIRPADAGTIEEMAKSTAYIGVYARTENHPNTSELSDVALPGILVTRAA